MLLENLIDLKKVGIKSGNFADYLMIQNMVRFYSDMPVSLQAL